MGNEGTRRHADPVVVREETVTSTLEAFLANSKDYIAETVRLIEASDPVIVRLLKSPHKLKDKNGERWAEKHENVSIGVGGLLAWRLLYNEVPDLPPVSSADMFPGVAVEPDIESVRTGNPSFYNFVVAVEAHEANPRLFRLGAMIVYRLKAATPKPLGRSN